MTTSTRLLSNKKFAESCYQNTVKYPNTTRTTFEGIPVELFDDFDYNDVLFTISKEIYIKHIKDEQNQVHPGAIKWIEQVIYEYTKKDGSTYPYWCIPKMRKKGGKPKYISSQNYVFADCKCEATVSVCEAKFRVCTCLFAYDIINVVCLVPLRVKIYLIEMPDLDKSGLVGVKCCFYDWPCRHPLMQIYQWTGKRDYSELMQYYPSVMHRKSIAQVPDKLAIVGNFSVSALFLF